MYNIINNYSIIHKMDELVRLFVYYTFIEEKNMINKEMYELGVKPSAIRNLFEYGKQRKAIIGEENVFDFSLGNPNVPAPKIVNDTLTKLINELDPTVLHGYTSAVGDNNVRNAIASYLNKTYREVYEELTEEEKNSVSHRGRAVEKLKAYFILQP